MKGQERSHRTKDTATVLCSSKFNVYFMNDVEHLTHSGEVMGYLEFRPLHFFSQFDLLLHFSSYMRYQKAQWMILGERLQQHQQHIVETRI
ncbi:hypothetical protein M0804_011546 [Polistes exclamans]|nr:hypothetical protein M0804_011546 [Polistes exclamans]